MNLKKKLHLYRTVLTENKEERTEKDEPKKTDIPYLDIWLKNGTKPYELNGEYCLIKEKRVPISEKCGKYCFQDYLKAVEAWQFADFYHPLSAKGYRPGDLFFFDTETTGLGGGVGNTIFLLGYAYIEGSSVVIRQHFLPEPGFEVPLYDSFLRSCDYTTLVTYNGKAFDWPQVKTRHTLIREHVPKLPAFGHFDLLHAARRLWKRDLESVKLSIVEKEILGIERTDDVPGYLAPIIYFDFIESKNPEGILKVMEHNEDDVLSLIILYTHISFQLLGLNMEMTPTEKWSVGNWFSALNESEKAIPVLEAAAKDADGREKWESLLELGLQYKKMKNLKKAFSYFEKVAENGIGKIKFTACIEAAKILEHQDKDFRYALDFCEQALQELITMERLSRGFSINQKADLKKRIKRLERKLAGF